MPVNPYVVGGALGAFGGGVGGALSSSEPTSLRDVLKPAGLGALFGAGAGAAGTRLSRDAMSRLFQRMKSVGPEAVKAKNLIQSYTEGIARAEKELIPEAERNIYAGEGAKSTLYSNIEDIESSLRNANLVGSPELQSKLTEEAARYRDRVREIDETLNSIREGLKLQTGQLGAMKRNLGQYTQTLQDKRKEMGNILKRQLLLGTASTVAPGALAGFAAGKIAPFGSEAEKTSGVTSLQKYVAPEIPKIPLSKKLAPYIQQAAHQLRQTFARPGAIGGGLMGGMASYGVQSPDNKSLKNTLGGAAAGALAGGLAGRRIMDWSRKLVNTKENVDVLKRLHEEAATAETRSSLRKTLNDEVDRVLKDQNDITNQLRNTKGVVDAKSGRLLSESETNSLLQNHENARSNLASRKIRSSLRDIDSDLTPIMKSHASDREQKRFEYYFRRTQEDSLRRESAASIPIGATTGVLSAIPSYMGGVKSESKEAQVSKTAGVRDIAVSTGKGALIGLGAAGGAALLNAAVGKAKDIYQDLHKATYYKEMLDVNPQLSSEDVNPVEVQRHFNTLFKFNPDYASDPVVAGTYVKNSLDFARPGLDTINNLVNARRNISQTQSHRVSFADIASKATGRALEGALSNAPEYTEMVGWG
jgi:hypothetical protein